MADLPSSDTWDQMRARTWEPDTDDLTAVLGLIGAGGKPPAAQRQILRQWMTTAAFVPAPATLKAKIETFLSTGRNPDE